MHLVGQTPPMAAPGMPFGNGAVPEGGWCENFTGRYMDGPFLYTVSQNGNSVTVSSDPARPETPAAGKVAHDTISIFGLNGKLVGGSICWSNGTRWTSASHPQVLPAMPGALRGMMPSPSGSLEVGASPLRAVSPPRMAPAAARAQSPPAHWMMAAPPPGAMQMARSPQAWASPPQAQMVVAALPPAPTIVSEKQVGGSRLSLLEADYFTLKQQVHDLEWECGDVDSEHKELARAHLTLGDAFEDEKRLATSLQDLLAEAEASREQLAEAHASAEADLRTVKDSSRVVLQNCRDLQGKVRELEDSRQEKDSQIEELERIVSEHGSMLQDVHENHRGLYEERDAQGRVHLLRIEELTSELESHQNGGVSHSVRILELEDLLRGHQQEIAGHKEEAARVLEEFAAHREEIEGHRSNHDKHLTRAQELEELLRSANTELESARGTHTKRNTVHVTRIEELNSELESARGKHGDLHTQHTVRIGALEALLEENGQTHITQRLRIAELEELVNLAKVVEDTHKKQHEKYRVQIGGLQEELLGHQTQASQHKSRNVVLERQVAEHLLGEEGHTRQYATHRARIADLERLLAEAEEAKGRGRAASVTISSHHPRLVEMENQLADAQTLHGKEVAKHRARATELEQLLEELQGNESGHRRKHATLANQIKTLEAQVLEFEAAEESHKRQHTTKRQTIQQLEEQLEGVQQGQGGHLSQISMHKNKVVELELELERVLKRELSKSAALDVEIAEFRRLEAGHQATVSTQRQRIQELEGALQDFERQAITLRDEAMNAKRHAQEVEKDSKDFMDRQDELNRKMNKEWEERLRQEQDRNRSLDEQAQSAERARKSVSQSLQPRSTVTHGPRSTISSSLQTPSPSSRQSTIGGSLSRKSLYGSVAKKRIVGELLPGSTDPFVYKVRQATRFASEAFKAASNVHGSAVENQLTAMLKARQSGRPEKESLVDYQARGMIEAEQRAAYSEVEAASHDFKSLLEEMELQHHLSSEERDEILTRINLEVDKCEVEMALLSSPASLNQLPDAFARMLVDVHSTGKLDQSSWYNGLSPMHIATQLGRRDVIEFLLTLPGGEELLQMHDHQGRTPLYHAQSNNQTVLEHWLREEAGVTAPIRQDQRPSVSGIPAQYLQLLEQIESTGWNSVSWKNGFTMLHWAAGKGHADFCKYLVQLDADPSMQDRQMRTPLDLAKNAGHSQAVAVLEEIQRNQ